MSAIPRKKEIIAAKLTEGWEERRLAQLLRRKRNNEKCKDWQLQEKLGFLPTPASDRRHGDFWRQTFQNKANKTAQRT